MSWRRERGIRVRDEKERNEMKGGMRGMRRRSKERTAEKVEEREK